MSIRLRLTIYWSAIIALILFAAGLLIIVMFARAMWGTLDAALIEEADTTAAALSRATAPDIGQILRRLSQEKDLGPGRRVRLIAGGHPVFDAGDAGAAAEPVEACNAVQGLEVLWTRDIGLVHQFRQALSF